MILDTIDNLKHYASLNPLFPKVVEFIEKNDLNALEAGKHIIVEGDLFVNIQDAKARTREEARLESHEVMIDIQIPLSASEEMGYTPLCDVPQTEMDKEKDIAFYPGLAESYFTVKPGEFALFFPQDVHAPAISQNGVRKAIFKVKV